MRKKVSWFFADTLRLSAENEKHRQSASVHTCNSICMCVCMCVCSCRVHYCWLSWETLSHPVPNTLSVLHPDVDVRTMHRINCHSDIELMFKVLTNAVPKHHFGLSAFTQLCTRSVLSVSCTLFLWEVHVFLLSQSICVPLGVQAQSLTMNSRCFKSQ